MIGKIIYEIEKRKLNSYIKQPPIKSNWNYENKSGEIIYITVAFNNYEVVDYQVKLLQKYQKGDFLHLVLDNSSDVEMSSQIERLCDENKVAYIKLPENRFKLSKSHGSALNWACRNILDKTEFEYVGFLDHDCFPIKEMTWKSKMKKQPFYGISQQRKNSWYIWPGFCFFDLKSIDSKKLNFMPVYGIGDTGGMNYLTIFKEYNKDSIIFPSHTYKEICNNSSEEVTQAKSIEIFDNEWVHLMNASNWLKIEVGEKNMEVKKYLESYL